MSSETPPRLHTVLGVAVDGVDYDDALARIMALSSAAKPSAVSVCNSRLVAAARSDATLAAALECFDLVVPGDYPLIWRMNARGAGLADRVAGPHLMRQTLRKTPAPAQHFFFGNSGDNLQRLIDLAKAVQPGIQIAGSLTPPDQEWTEEMEAGIAQTIRESQADFIWVALEERRQEKWIATNLHRHDKGVFLAVGDAPGTSSPPDLPQRLGLSWLNRPLAHSLRLNALFLFYTLRDALLGSPHSSARLGAARPHVAFLGSRGVPARYSGFEVVVEHLGSRLAERGYPVTVYNRYPRFDLPTKTFKGMRIAMLPTIPTKSLDTISHTALSALHALTQRYDVIYLCGVGNAIIGGFLRLVGYKVIINVDGADFNRAKWGSVARNWLRISESWAMKIGHKVIADNSEIVSRYQREYGASPVHLSYGAIIREEKIDCGELLHWGLAPRSYILFVSRLTPENQGDLLLRAFAKYKGPLKLVICGGANYEQAHFRTLQSLADDRVIFTGPRYGDSYLELSQNAAFYVMPADIEATRLVLLDQLGMGTAILYNDCAATREVVGDAAEPFNARDAENSLAEKITVLSENPARCEELRRLALQRAKDCFHWNLVVDRYEELFKEIGGPTGAVKNS